MITYINEKNASQYEVLFSKATDILTKRGLLVPESDDSHIKYNQDGYVPREYFEKNPQDFFVKNQETGEFEACESASQYDINTIYYVRNVAEITTLEKYFSVLKDLLVEDGGHETDELYERTHSQGRRFTMLPLDSEVFEVNANTREISVPETFRKYGIAVQGDDLAEVVYFKIDRFFDATDLDSCDCYIQWEAPTGQIGVSYPWVIDIESDPNKMIIGWALSKQISSEPGNVKFSLRFYKVNDEGELIFSFGTLTSMATVKSTLNVDMKKIGTSEIFKEVAADTSIVNRIATSTTKVTNVTPVNAPVWDAPTITAETYYDLDPTKQWTDDDMGAVVLTAMAHSTDSGIISYDWRKVAKDGSIGHIVETKEYVPFKTAHPTWTVADAKNSGIAFYVQGQGTPDNKERYAFSESTTEEDLQFLFERRSAAKVGAVGTYHAVATNRKGFSTKTSISPAFVVPAPVAFDIVNQYAPAIELKEDTSLFIEVAQKDKAQPTAAEGTGDAVLSYEWKLNGELIENENNSTLEVKEAGWYQGIVTNTRNEAIVSTRPAPEGYDPEESIDQYIDPLYVAYVAPHATPAQLAYPVAADFNAKAPGSTVDNAVQVYANELDQAAVLDKLKVEVDYENWGVNEFVCGDRSDVVVDGKQGSLTYQWYQVKETPDTELVAGQTADDILIEGANTAKLNPTADASGVFYCKITNTLINGTSAEAYSPLFLIVNTN